MSARSLAAQVAAVVPAVRAACVAAGEPDPLDEATDLRWRHEGPAGFRAAAGDGGFGLEHADELTLAVAPERRGRGLADRLLTELRSAAGVTAWSHGDHPAAARLATRHGWTRDRELWVMRRPSSTPLPAWSRPDAVTVRGYLPDDDARLLEVNAAAFAHHPEQGGLDAEGLAERLAEPWFDAAGLLLALDDHDGSLLGFHWTKRHDPTLGEVYVVAVAPGAQGRGVGRVLTLAGLHHLVEGGAEEVLLYVEADNAPARRLYEGLGFTHAASDTHVQYAHG